MWEKIAGAVAVVIAMPMLGFFKAMGLPTLLLIPLGIACTFVSLIGVIFLFSQGTILKRQQRVKTASRAAPAKPSLETS